MKGESQRVRAAVSQSLAGEAALIEQIELCTTLCVAEEHVRRSAVGALGWA